jgi:DNA repair protein RadD
MNLYPYQEEAVRQIRELYQKGTKKVLLHLATGGGKTHIFSHIIEETSKRGNKCMMVVKGRELVKNASQRLEKEGVDHGVMMAGHWRVRPLYPVQVCSVDTLYRRKQAPPAKLIVIDEAHMATSDSYQWLAQQYPDAFFLAVTATPYVDKSLKHVAEATVHPITINELIEQGFLVPCRHYAPSTPDLKGIRTVNKDYETEELARRMDILTGDIVKHWKNHAENRPSICFAVNIRHSLSLMETFKASGIPTEHMDANTDDAEREAIFERLRGGHTKIVCNVGILGVGVDLPLVSCIIMARPTKSYNLYIQQAGRGTRTFAGKKDFILLDHAGNAKRHGLITDEQEVTLDGEYTGKKPKTCHECLLVYLGSNCPACGPRTESMDDGRGVRSLNHLDGDLEEITETPIEIQVHRFIKELKKIKREKGYKRGWIYYKLVDKFGQELADKYFPKREIPWFIQAKLAGGKNG